MDMEMEQIATLEGLDEDLLFADLEDRISLLILEDEDIEEFPAAPSPSDPFQAYLYGMTARPIFAPPRFAHDYEAPYRREATKGTGVFIPTSTILPRKNRSGRSKQGNNKGRKTGRLELHPKATQPANRLSNSHTPSTCISNTSLGGKHRQQLSSRKKEMLIC